ncbi:guanylate-binding protein 1-like [Alosa alosa]|nr:guanylate-binding protein 1-like [Alosa alosa]XP_048125695.1 guanylate-binding protein 1-like [Alosa alosa]XP_048125696.1 guanylate-binding protein 1-like [Alosa alosa]
MEDKAAVENKAAVEDGVGVYRSGMEQLKQFFPVELTLITSEHQRLHTEAVQTFMKRRFKNDQGEYLKSLEEHIDQHLDQYLLHNEEASKKRCQDLLTSLSADMTTRLQKGLYAKPRGYVFFCQHMETIVEKYNRQTATSVKAKEVLEEFFKNKHVESEAIRQADVTLSKQRKRICEETEKVYLLRQKMKSEEEKMNKLEAKMKADKDSFEEKMRQIEGKNKEETKREEEEFEKVLERKMREQREVLEKGLESQAEKLKQEVEETKTKHEETKVMQAEQFELMMEKFRKERQQQEKRYEETMTMMNQQYQQTMIEIRQQNERALEEMQHSDSESDGDSDSDGDGESHCTIL